MFSQKQIDLSNKKMFSFYLSCIFPFITKRFLSTGRHSVGAMWSMAHALILLQMTFFNFPLTIQLNHKFSPHTFPIKGDVHGHKLHFILHSALRQQPLSLAHLLPYVSPTFLSSLFLCKEQLTRKNRPG